MLPPAGPPPQAAPPTAQTPVASEATLSEISALASRAGLTHIHMLAWRDLDLALLCWADWKWIQERANNWQSHPLSWQARSLSCLCAGRQS